MIKVISVLTTLCLYGCSAPKFYDIESCRVPSATRCGKLNQVEMCGPNEHWMPVMRCQDMGPDWFCSDHPHVSCEKRTP